MKSPDQPKVAFIGWNPFQFLHFGPLAAGFAAPAFVIEERKGARGVFDMTSISTAGAEVLHLDRREMGGLDGKFDILVCQTPFAGIGEIRKSRIAMLQYGYAKEAHNFAPWRAFADVCMTFGDYASRKIEPFSPCVATGNPRYDAWWSGALRESAATRFAGRLDPSRKTLLYAPTWGELSSFHPYSEALLKLADDYNIILKIHHNTQLAGAHVTDSIRGRFATVCDTNDDIVELLAVSDLMISDYSGAIFDAIHCRVPVVLLNHADASVHSEAKSDAFSLEQSSRSRLGHQVDSPAGLRRAVESSLAGAGDWLAGLEPLRSDLFADTGDAASRAKNVILGLAEGQYQANQAQQYIRHEMRNYYRCRTELSSARSFAGFSRMLVNQIRRKLPGS